MQALISGQVIGVRDQTTSSGKKLVEVDLLQQNRGMSDLIRVRLWNGKRPAQGEKFSEVCRIRAAVTKRGTPILNVDVFADSEAKK